MSQSKQATTSFTQTQAGAAASQQTRAKDLLHLALASLAVGGGVAGLSAMPKMLDTTPDDTLPEPEDNYVPIGNVQPNKLVHKYPLVKGAEDGWAARIAQMQSHFGNAAKTVGDGVSHVSNELVKKLVPAENTNSFGGYAGPGLAAAAIALPGAAGYYGVKSLMKGYEEDSREAELQDAKRKFEEAQAAQYAHMLRQKSALDDMYEQRETLKAGLAKSAGTDPNAPASSPLNGVPDLPGSPMTGTYGGIASRFFGGSSEDAMKRLIGLTLATAGAAGVGGYMAGKNLTSSTTREQLKKKILKQRAAALAGRPYAALPANFAIPTDNRLLKAATTTPTES